MQPWTTVASRVYATLHAYPSVVCGQKWTSPKDDVVFVDQSSAAALPLVEVLARSGLQICTCPDFVPKGFAAAGREVTSLTPELVRQHFLRYDAPHMNVEECTNVLRYLLSEGCSVKALHGLQVFPAADGTIRAIGPGQPLMLIPSNQLEYELLEHAGEMVLHSMCCLDTVLSASLMPVDTNALKAHNATAPIRAADKGLTKLSLETLRNHVLTRLLPPDWYSAPVTGVGGSEGHSRVSSLGRQYFADWTESLPSPRGSQNKAIDVDATRMWIRTFWKVMSMLIASANASHNDALSSFQNVFLLPGENGNLYPVATLSPFHGCAAQAAENSDLANCLRELGVTAIDESYCVPSTVIAHSNNSTTTGAVDCITHVLELTQRASAVAFSQCTVAQRVALLRYCCSTPHSFSSSHLAFLATVPFLQTHTAPTVNVASVDTDSDTAAAADERHTTPDERSHERENSRTARRQLPATPGTVHPDSANAATSRETPPADDVIVADVMVAVRGSDIVSAPAGYSSELLGSRFVKVRLVFLPMGCLSIVCCSCELNMHACTQCWPTSLLVLFRLPPN